MLGPTKQARYSASPAIPWSYARAGVSIDRGNALVDRIKVLAKRTRRPGALGSVGGFSGFFDPSAERIASPLLVATTDGVGTKLELAHLLDKHDTMGVDLVAMCVNDLICTGATPLFFLDYYACGRLDVEIAEEVLRGIVRGCREARCVLVGGETAEMPAFYPGARYDLAGFAVGMVDRRRVIDGRNIEEGDLLVGLASSGFHSNGFSLLRKLFSRKEIGGQWGRRLLTPTRIYVKPVLALSAKVRLKGIAHITGGAFIEKVPRIIPAGLCAVIHVGSWPCPKIFLEVRRRSRMTLGEMFRTFNMGIGMVFAIGARDLLRTKHELAKFPVENWVIGEIVNSRGQRRIMLKGELLS